MALTFFTFGCVGMSTTDGDSTKRWLSIASSKTDLDGGNKDICYALNIRFNPKEAINRVNTDLACITRCCWYSENKIVEINLNNGLNQEFQKNGFANKYSQDKLTFKITYSPFLDTVHAKMEPSSLIDSSGLITLPYTQLRDEKRFLDGSIKTTESADVEDNKPNITASNYILNTKNSQVLLDQTALSASPVDSKLHDAAVNAAVAEVLETKEEAFELPKGNTTPDINNAQDTEALLRSKLSYERAQAVALLKRFYNQDIDAYILSIDKAQKQKGQVLLANERKWIAVKIGAPIYKVSCRVEGQLGKTQKSMKPYPIACGVYKVDLDEKTVKPIDSIGLSIANGEYKN